jgi:hypothetical protein
MKKPEIKPEGSTRSFGDMTNTEAIGGLPGDKRKAIATARTREELETALVDAGFNINDLGIKENIEKQVQAMAVREGLSLGDDVRSEGMGTIFNTDKKIWCIDF